MHRTWLLVPVALAACEDPPPEAQEAPVERPSPSPYEPTVTPGAGSELTVEQAEAELPALLDRLLASDPEGIRDRFNVLMGHADATCPLIETYQTAGGPVSRWNVGGTGCTSADGTRFRGEARYGPTDAVVDGVPTTGWNLESQLFEISTPGGRFMRGGLTIVTTAQTRPDGLLVDSLSMRASVEADATTAAGASPWLTGELRGDVVLIAARQGPARLFQATAVVQSSDALVTATEIDALTIDNISCPDGGLSGAVALRDGLGGWHDVFFGSEDAPSCSACADLDFEGESLGELCLSLERRTQLLNWETTPW